mmetsp:Transcript_101272/g.185499  ORF Transcript_101272/g.185499 Transcript_101272/m.185499 type:complete len:226 (+) Transcript_101272:1336-2013(+)
MFPQTPESALLSRAMGVQNNFLSGILGITSGLHGSDVELLPLPSFLPFDAGGPLPKPFLGGGGPLPAAVLGVTLLAASGDAEATAVLSDADASVTCMWWLELTAAPLFGKLMELTAARCFGEQLELIGGPCFGEHMGLTAAPCFGERLELTVAAFFGEQLAKDVCVLQRRDGGELPKHTDARLEAKNSASEIFPPAAKLVHTELCFPESTGSTLRAPSGNTRTAS